MKKEMTPLEKALIGMINRDGTCIGNFWGILQILGIEPELKILNYSGTYKDRFRKDINDRFPIQLDVSVASRLRDFPLEELSEFIRHLKMITEDAERIRLTLQNKYGISEDHNRVEGFENMAKVLSEELKNKLYSDPLALKSISENNGHMLVISNMLGGKTIVKAIRETAEELIQ